MRRASTLATFIAVTIWSVTALAGSPVPLEKEAEPEASKPGDLNPIGVKSTAVETKAPRIEVVFALDTTGSMKSLINGAKEKIWSIANSIARAEPTPEIRMGLLAYRDRGDDYVTRLTPLTTDLDAVYEDLMEYRAEGGGDTPESVNQALYEAVNDVDWTPGDDVYKVVFLVGDSPPKMNYKNDVKYPVTCKRAAQRGIIINTIQCGDRSSTKPVWKRVARLTDGAFNIVGQSGDAMVASTPYDDELSDLAAKLDETRVYYGSADKRKKARKRKERSRRISKKATSSAKARRAVYNVSKSGRKGHIGKGDIIEDVSSGDVELSKISEEELPERMRGMSADQKKEFVEEGKAKRKALKKKIATVSSKRSKHIEKELEKRADKGSETLSQKVFDSVVEQAEKKKIRFKSKKASH